MTNESNRTIFRCRASNKDSVRSIIMSAIPAFLEISAEILCEFFEIVINSILYMREIYPLGIFEKRLKYGIPVNVSQHPELNQYITNCLQSLKPMLTKNEVGALVIAILDSSDCTVERFVLELPCISTDLGTCTHSLESIAESLRTFCLGIITCSDGLKPLPKDCHFVIQVHAKKNVRLNESFTCKNFTWMNASVKKSLLNRPVITPLGNSSNALFKMQLFMETKSTEN